MADKNVNTYWIWIIRLILFLTVLDIAYDESVDSTFRNLKNGGIKMADHKLNPYINLGEIWYLGVPDILLIIN